MKRTPDSGVPCTVYALKSSGEEGPRYVGQTSEGLRARLSRHKCAARAGQQTPVSRWVREQHEQGHTIDIVPLTAEGAAVWNETEIRMIKAFTDAGVKLLNVHGGGGGREGYEIAYRPTPEHRAKLAAAQRGRRQSPETKKKIGEGSRRAWQRREQNGY